MNGSLRVLIAEDNPADVELVLRELRRAGFSIEWQVVDNEREYLSLLRPDLDLVLSDFDMPQFTGSRALEVVRRADVDVGLVLVAGNLNEDL